MPNLILTNSCNLACPFCFASEYCEKETARHKVHMSLEEYRRHLVFIGTRTVRLCGGEPTLHPNFAQMLDLALETRKREVMVMTNGVWPKAVRAHLGALPRRDIKRIAYLFNVLPKQHYDSEQLEQLHEALATVHRGQVTLGITIYKTDCDLGHLFELASRFEIERIRYSVAAPNVTDPRSWNIDATRDFPGFAQVVYALRMRAQALGLRVFSDCGYIPPCMFTEQQLAELYPKGGLELAEAFSCCGPTDIGSGGEAWRCFGLYSTMRASTGDFEDVGALEAYFEGRTAETPHADLLEGCSTCTIRERYACGGGCYALRSVAGMIAQAKASQVSIDDDSRFHEAVASIRPDNVHFVGGGSPSAVMFRDSDGSWARTPLSSWECDILTACDGRRTVAQLISIAAEQGFGASAAGVIRRFYLQGAIALSQAPTS